MSMAEVMVAMLILAAGSLAVLNLISASAHSSFRNQQTQVVSDRLQQEVERIQHLPYDKIALTEVPAGSTDQSSPALRMQGANYAVSQTGSQPASLVYNGSALYTGGSICDADHDCGVVDATPTRFTDGNVSGTIYRYVVWQDDPTCGTACPGTQDMKRVIVAIALDGTAVGGTHHYQEIQAELTDPDAKPASNSNPVSGQNSSGFPWTFWLTDTSCDHGSRQAVTGDHLTHDTRGVCSAGATSGTSPGAPDLMVNQAAPLTAETPLYDYATDVEPSQNASQDKGVQLLRGSGTTCDPKALTVATGPETDQPARFQQLHQWLSPPVPSGTTVQLTGTGTLDLWTETIGNVAYSGEICIWLFVRSTSAGAVSQTAAVNQDAPLTGSPYFTYAQNPWPAGWSELHIPLNFTLGTTLTEGTQLGLAIEADPAGTSSDGLQFLYDEPSFDSRFEAKTVASPPSLR
jgi:hypothetical protein